MNQPDTHPSEDPLANDGVIREAAARWIVRRDRGLSAAESIEFELWLAADERHARAIQCADTAWALLDRIPEDVAQSVRVKPSHRWARYWLAVSGLAAAAAIAVFFGWQQRGDRARQQQQITTEKLAHDVTRARVLTLPDGSTVRLNVGSEIVEAFTPAERRIIVARGEAHFMVTKNASRPFVVCAGAVEVRAVGTAFNVNLQSAAVEVIVTEGKVELNAAAAPGSAETVPTAAAESPRTVVGSSQRAVVTFAPASLRAALVVTDVPSDEITKALAWQNTLLRLGGATLAELAVEFQQQTGYRIVLADPELAGRRIGGRFRADNIEGFIRLLEEHFGVVSQRTPEGVIVLLKRP
jgi:transmembrane sensor